MANVPQRQTQTPSLRTMLIPLALAQFICSFAGSNMNVMITDISHDLRHHGPGRAGLHHAVPAGHGRPDDPVRQADRPYGRKRCFQLGLSIYGVGAVLSAVSPGLGVLILGNSIFEGVGTALLIPPVYILTTLLFTDMKSRAWAFGVISGMGGVGAATGPLIGGSDHHGHQLASGLRLPGHHHRDHPVVLGRSLTDPLPADPTRPFDTVGASCPPPVWSSSSGASWPPTPTWA